ncbi:hypothetical protein LSH36_845g02110 [Paralvinella palmiformis]|uniref:PID domain-containing protein n=1 Tax=Paralvinella palmiformis TaxID=53620 RepID=A0AAD9MRS8_9ANNE|nr:hypothetical protein LSH36_845g02110 [Paralvinella palmiformis]
MPDITSDKPNAGHFTFATADQDPPTSSVTSDVMESNDSGSDINQLSERLSQLPERDNDSRTADGDNNSVTSEQFETGSEHSQTGSERSQTGSQQSQTGLENSRAGSPLPECGSTPDHEDQEENTVDSSSDESRRERDNGVAPHENIDKHSKSKNPFKLLRRLTMMKAEKKGKESETETDGKSKLSKFDRILVEVKVDSLPQVFVTKYLGYKPCHGLWGIKHTQRPVDELIAEVSSLNPEDGEDLPLVQLRVSLSGIHTREHSANTCKSRRIGKELIPIEFISYGVQDLRHTRVFSFILVREMSSKSRNLECHVYVCDSTANCRRLSLSVALAFKEYSKNLDGKPYKFQVDLRSGEETVEGSDQDGGAGGEDFEA